MKCKNCGMELDPDSKICKACGLSVDETEQIKITYEDQEEEYVEPPVIVEAHTFIDEESFAKKINELDNTAFKKDNDKLSNVLKVLFGVLVFVIIGFVFTFVVLPNISKEKETNVLEDNTFTSEDWKSGEFMLDDEFYRVDDNFSKYFQKGWSFDSEEYTLNSILGAREETDSIELYNSFHKDSKITVSFVNKSAKEVKIKDSTIYDVYVDNTKSDRAIDFTLPGQITVGSKELEIQSIYGKLDEAFITYDDVLMATTYHYSYNDNKILDLIVYDNGGLKAFHYTFK